MTCRDCTGTGLAKSREKLCARCNGVGESELTEAEKAEESRRHQETVKKLNSVFSSMLLGAGVHPSQMKRRKR
jgi:RecJ-like exonuclease